NESKKSVALLTSTGWRFDAQSGWVYQRTIITVANTGLETVALRRLRSRLDRAGSTARQFLRMVMRGEIDPEPKQLNAAKVLIEYEEPRLSAVAVGHLDGNSFAQALERCLARSSAPYIPKPALPAPEQHPASELKGNFPMRRRNLR